MEAQHHGSGGFGSGGRGGSGGREGLDGHGGLGGRESHDGCEADDGRGHGAVGVVGETLIDLLPVGGAEYRTGAGDSTGDMYQAVPGGSPANVAVGLARLAVPTRMAARISRDPLGRILRSRLADPGVDLRGVVEAAEPGAEDSVMGVTVKRVTGRRRAYAHYAHEERETFSASGRSAGFPAGGYRIARIWGRLRRCPDAAPP